MRELDTPPVLFLIFNRLSTTQQVFAAIRAAQPRRLYIAADGPRLERLGEAVQVQLVRDYVLSQIDWDCEVKTLFRVENLGCRIAVSSAIDWFFAQEEEGIILEDDCLPDASFFAYAAELLRRYRYDQRIMAIGGTHLQRDHPSNDSYFFSRNIEIWGWASWRRAWQYYDREIRLWPNLRDTDWLLSIGEGNPHFQRYWQRIFDQVFAGQINTWDYQWVFTCWSQHGLTILPTHNLIRNLGFSDNATHTSDSDTRLANLPLESLALPLSHPPNIVKDYAADRWCDRYIQKITFSHDLITRLRSVRMLKSIWRFIQPLRSSLSSLGKVLRYRPSQQRW
jgi:hypothetical protein